jgi:hypothetical protein
LRDLADLPPLSSLLNDEEAVVGALLSTKDGELDKMPRDARPTTRCVRADSSHARAIRVLEVKYPAQFGPDCK